MVVGAYVIISVVEAKVKNKEVIYFGGELSYYNPVNSKSVLLIPDKVRGDFDLICMANPYRNYEGETLYTVVLYAHNAMRVMVNSVVTNDEYRSIYGVDHPCYIKGDV